MRVGPRTRVFLKRTGKFLAAGIGLILAFVAWTNLAAVLAGSGRLYEKPEEVPGGRVGVVFGCDDYIGGHENLYFRYRIDATAELWREGKLSCVIVSGDNRRRNYNEPLKMRRALVEAGVPEDKIVSDYAGRRTFDSVVRAKEIFDAGPLTFISQKFQNQRAAYIAKSNDIDFVGYNARDVEGRGGFRTKLREIGARVKMWLDVRVLGTRPQVLGEREQLPL